ncbi:Icc-related predicted phosphoesterase [Microbacterium sp. SORGH_AS 1204]|nr:Icc-related predicted phosphoesterase [Microbacterium sp. SORGH_AS_1204]
MASVQFGQHAPAARVILHLSDTHLLGGDRLLGERYDTARHLRRTLRAAEKTRVRPDAVVFTGDLTDLGEPEAYRALRAEVEPWAERLGAPVIWVAGNHDERPAMRAQLLDAEANDEPVTGVYDLGGLRLIALDSTVPGWHHGDLDAAQLTWLRGELAEPAPLGTILALHHPPLPTHIPFFDILELRDQSALADIVRGSDVRAILAGHLHYSTSGTFAGVPVSVAAASLLHDGPRPPRRRGERDGCRALVPPRARVARHDHACRRAGRRRGGVGILHPRVDGAHGRAQPGRAARGVLAQAVTSGPVRPVRLDGPAAGRSRRAIDAPAGADGAAGRGGQGGGGERWIGSWHPFSP